ncbi:hypothetical protein PG997_015017 [Apiospora hydei]|uniref:Uncharacterized protein n=1 Tax=Apiospora hydei TaxID=1337664 RepID=A0ABR1UVJ7_9PEZI
MSSGLNSSNSSSAVGSPPPQSVSELLVWCRMLLVSTTRSATYFPTALSASDCAAIHAGSHQVERGAGRPWSCGAGGVRGRGLAGRVKPSRVGSRSSRYDARFWVLENPHQHTGRNRRTASRRVCAGGVMWSPPDGLSGGRTREIHAWRLRIRGPKACCNLRRRAVSRKRLRWCLDSAPLAG